MNDSIEVPFGDAALTTDQAGQYLGLAPMTLAVMRSKGNGPPYVKYSRRAVRYRLSDLQKWMDNRTLENTARRVN